MSALLSPPTQTSTSSGLTSQTLDEGGRLGRYSIPRVPAPSISSNTTPTTVTTSRALERWDETIHGKHVPQGPADVSVYCFSISSRGKKCLIRQLAVLTGGGRNTAVSLPLPRQGPVVLPLGIRTVKILLEM